MTSVSSQAPAASIPSQHIQATDLTAPARSDATRDDLVAMAAHLAKEQAELSRNLARIDAIERELAELAVVLREDAANRTPADVQMAHKRQLIDLARELQALRHQTPIAASAIQHLPELMRERDSLQSQLDRGGMPWKERTAIEARVGRLEHEIERAQFDAAGGGGPLEFLEFRAPRWQQEAGLLRSRLADGGLSPEVQQRTEDRLAYVEQTLAVIEKNIAMAQQHLRSL